MFIVSGHRKINHGVVDGQYLWIYRSFSRIWTKLESETFGTQKQDAVHEALMALHKNFDVPVKDLKKKGCVTGYLSKIDKKSECFERKWHRYCLCIQINLVRVWPFKRIPTFKCDVIHHLFFLNLLRCNSTAFPYITQRDAMQQHAVLYFSSLLHKAIIVAIIVLLRSLKLACIIYNINIYI